MVSGYPTSTNFRRVDGLSTDPWDWGITPSIYLDVIEALMVEDVQQRMMLESGEADLNYLGFNLIFGFMPVVKEGTFGTKTLSHMFNT